MQVGIGLPATIPGIEGKHILEWAKKADAGPFSSLSILDRLVYPNYEPLITLAAVAGATQRIRLMPTVLLVTLRNTAMLAKQAASLDALSGGRLTLGVGVGGREDDFLAASIPFNNRGKRFEEQLTTMMRIWSGQPLSDNVGPGGTYLRNYYGFMGPMVERMINSLPTTLEAIKGNIQGYADVGADEVIMWPCTPDLEQIDQLANLVG